MQKQRIIRIDSDGMPAHTIISTDDGREIDQVIRAEWSLEVKDMSRVILEVYGTAIHAEGTLDMTHLNCPICGDTVEHECNSD